MEEVASKRKEFYYIDGGGDDPTRYDIPLDELPNKSILEERIEDFKYKVTDHEKILEGKMNALTINMLTAIESKRFEIRIDPKDVKPVKPIFSSNLEVDKYFKEKYGLGFADTLPSWIELDDDEDVAFEYEKELFRPAVAIVYHLANWMPKEYTNIGIPPYTNLVKTFNKVIKMYLDFIEYATNFRKIRLEEVLLIKKKYLEMLKEATLEIRKVVDEYVKKYGEPIYVKLTPYVKRNVFSLTIEERKIYEWNLMNIKHIYYLIREVVLTILNSKYYEIFENNIDENFEVVEARDRLRYGFLSKFRSVIYDNEFTKSIVQKNAFDEVSYIVVKDDVHGRINIGIAHDRPERLPAIDFDTIERFLSEEDEKLEAPLEIRLEFKDEKHREMLPLLDVDEISIRHVYKPVRVRGVVGNLQPKITRLWRVRVYDKDAEDGWKYRYILLPQTLYTERGTRAKILPAVDNIRIETQLGELQLFPEELEKSRKASTSIRFVLEGSLVDKVLPGERYEFVAIPFYRDPAKDGDIYLYVTDVRKIGMFDDFKITEEDVKRFKEIKRQFETEKRAEVEELSRKVGLKVLPMIYVYLKSFAPEIRLTRTNVMLKLAFLIPAVRGALQNTREIPHSLIIGEPSTGKTHLAKELAKIHPKALYVSGKSATGIGLTVSVNKDKVTGQWYASPGMIVLADGGVLVIDELDKANKEDRSNLYEALEDGKVTVAKASVFKTMPARTSVIGIANPPAHVLKSVKDVKALFKKAGFDPAFVSRFDIIVVALDETSYEDDVEDAMSIFKHATGQKFDTVIDYEEMTKLLAYSMSIRPKIPLELGRYLAERYAELRKKARETGDDTYKIKKRNLEGILRIATALAKLNLDEELTKEHIDLAIEIFEYSQRIRKEAEKEFKVSKNEVKEQVMGVIREKGIKTISENDFTRIAKEVVERFNYDESLLDQIEAITVELITRNLVKEKLAEFDAEKNVWRLKLGTIDDYVRKDGPSDREAEYLEKDNEERVSEARELILKLAREKGEVTDGVIEAVKVELRERHGRISDELLAGVIGEAIDRLVGEGVLKEEFEDGRTVWRVVKIPQYGKS